MHGTPRCWICGSSHTYLWKRRNHDRPLTTDDLRITDSRYGTTLELWQCRRCEFQFAPGAEDEIADLYEDLADEDYLGSRSERRLQMNGLLDIVLQARPNARTLLDIGAGAGVLVAEAARRGLHAIGVEPSRAHAATARSIGAHVLPGTLPHPDLADETFDIVCLVDVLEHVTNPLPLLGAAASVLNPAGILLVVTPDRGSFAAKLLGKHWWHYRLAHIGYFNKASMRWAAARAGLVMVTRSRARWFFTIEYLAARVARYVPARNLALAKISSRWGKSVLRRVIVINPRDSMVVVFTRSSHASAL